MMLAESDHGWSIRDLWEQVCRRKDLTDTSRNRLSRILMVSLGRDWLEARRARFDPDSAHREIRVYPAEGVPRVDCEIPPSVSDVRFRSDLTNAAPLQLSQLESQGGLFEAVFG